MIASSCVDFNHSLMDLGSHFTQPVIWVSGRAGRKVAGVLLALLGGGFTGVQSMGSPGTCEKNCDPMKPCYWCVHGSSGNLEVCTMFFCSFFREIWDHGQPNHCCVLDFRGGVFAANKKSRSAFVMDWSRCNEVYRRRCTIRGSYFCGWKFTECMAGREACRSYMKLPFPSN